MTDKSQEYPRKCIYDFADEDMQDKYKRIIRIPLLFVKMKCSIKHLRKMKSCVGVIVICKSKNCHKNRAFFIRNLLVMF